MKRFLHIYLLLFPLLSFAQAGQDSNPVLDFAWDNYSKKVGTGLCLEFVVDAENTKYKNWYEIYYNLDSLNAHRVTLGKVTAGDIIMLDGVREHGKERATHIGIVFEVNGYEVSYLSQNVGEGKLVEKYYKGKKQKVLVRSKVLGSIIVVNKIIEGNIYYFHF